VPVKITQKITAFFLLSIFLFNTMGYFVAFKVAQYQIKSAVFSDIREGINLEKATLITLKKAEVNSIVWLEKGKEMRYNNQLYDIVKYTENKETITYYCLSDKLEQHLFSHLNEHINTHVTLANPGKNKSSTNIKNSVVKLFFPHCFQYNLKTSEVNIRFSTIKEDFISAAIGTNSPPPRLV